MRRQTCLAIIAVIIAGIYLQSCQDGIFATVWAIQHAIEVNPGGINGPAECQNQLKIDEAVLGVEK